MPVLSLISPSSPKQLGMMSPELGRFFPLRLCGATVHQELSDSGQLNQIRDQSYR